MGESQEADEVDRAGPEGEHERRELGEEPPRTGGESLDMDAVRFPRSLPKGRIGGGEREDGDGEGAGPAPGDVTQLRAFISDDHSVTSCGGCRATIARGHRVVELPCGRQHAMHARCVVNAVRRGGAQAPLLCGTRGCTVRLGRREAIEAAFRPTLDYA